jgi:hypothetical protein
MMDDWEKKIASHGFVVWFICWFFIDLAIPFWFVGNVFVGLGKEIYDTYKVHRVGA